MSMAWAELPPWHEAAFNRLAALHQQGRLAHAFLLQGRPGLGKGLLARYLAQALLCQTPGEGHPCGGCSACLLLAAGTHPDLRLVQPEERRNIVIDQIRDTVEFMSKTAQQGGRKVIVIDPAECMNVNAANALLKGLEEPAPGTLLLLVSQQGGILPATIRSRCQSLKFTAPPRAAALAWLEERQADQPALLLDLAEGAPLRALALADEEARRERGAMTDSLAGLLQGEIGPVEAAAHCAGFSLAANVEGMMLCLNDLLRSGQSAGKIKVKNKEINKLINKLKVFSIDEPQANDNQVVQRLHDLYEKLLDARRAMASNSNPNPQLQLESLFHAWAALRL